MCLGNSSQYSYTMLIRRKGSARQQDPFLLDSKLHLLAPPIVPLDSGKLWDPDLGEEKHPAESSCVAAGKGGGWGGEGFESPSGVYLCFFFFVFLFFWFSVAWSGTKGEKTGKRRRGVGVTEASFPCTIAAHSGRAISHRPWINLTNLFYLTI